MTAAQIEERVSALENNLALLRADVAQLKQLSPNGASPSTRDDLPDEVDLMPGVEYNWAPRHPEPETIPIQIRIVGLEEGPKGLGLSADEWARLDLEDDN